MKLVKKIRKCRMNCKLRNFKIESLDDDLDEISLKAFKILLEANRISASLLQRVLCIGYPRAVDILTELEEKNYIDRKNNRILKKV